LPGLLADDPTVTFQAALEAGLTEVKHPSHPYYFIFLAIRCSSSAPTQAEHGTHKGRQRQKAESRVPAPHGQQEQIACG
jgi:hypothetical protein